MDWVKQNRFIHKRLEYLRGLMSRLLYKEEQIPILAEKWGISQTVVKSHIAEASRTLEVLQGDNDKRGREVTSMLLLELCQEARAAGEFVAAVSAAKAAGEFMTTPRTQKLDVTHEVRTMSDDDLLLAYKRELAAAQELLKGQEAPKLARGVAVMEAEFTEDEVEVKAKNER